ncbi:coiled-coil domain-containing protein 80 [Alosa sapidissima]|uniref:coiled-coil domain-containing protein 80 n=1 Tax=Alosa sapidissima TaxID=34773 RepID=UPI001C09B57A|nr:coiled-coil domain-containing protein 80 [Alosa sapidissima]
MKCPILYCCLVMLAIAKSISEVLPQADTQLRGMHRQAYRKSSQSQHSDTVIKRHIENIAKSAGGVAGPTTSGNSGPFIKPQGNMSLDPLSTAQAGRVQKNRRPPHPRKVAPTNSASIDHSGPQPGHLTSPARQHLNISASISVLARFAGRNRLLLISAPRKSDSYYQLLRSQMKAHAYCEMAERHMHQIVVFHQEGEAGGVVRHITKQGAVIEEPLDATLVPQLMDFLKLEKGKFEMVLLKKTLQVEERYPYPVRLEAVYRAVDQAPARWLEKVRQEGFVQTCKESGVAGQVVKSPRSVPKSPKIQLDSNRDDKGALIKSTAISTIGQKTTITSSTTITTPSAPHAVTSTTATALNNDPSNAHRLPSASGMPTVDPFDHLSTKNVQSDSYQPNTITYTPTYNTHKTEFSLDRVHNQSDNNTEHTVSEVTKPSMKLNVSHEKKRQGEGTEKVTAIDIQDEIIRQKGQFKTGKIEKKQKSEKTEKTQKKSKAPKKPKAAKSGESAKYPEKKPLGEDIDGTLKLSDKISAKKKSLDRFVSYFEKRRRLIVVTAPTEHNRMYKQQRDEYLEHVCEMALRKVSIITIFGPLTNGTMKIDHYHMEQDKPMRGLQDDDLVNHELIMAFRRELGMTHDDFYMVLTDFEIKVKQQYEVPIAMKAVFDYMDTFTSRINEMEQQKKQGVMCKKEDKSRTLENFLSRFRWRRRLFVMSSSSDDEWAYQQQLYTLTSQACNLGLRHMAVLRLVGKEREDASGVLELYPINGSASVEREHLSASLVMDIRNYFQISPESFSMLLVGKDGNVKSWYPSPMWSMSTIYDLVDSMQLRRQEMAIQLSLGMRCPDDEYTHHEGHRDGYHRGYGY